MSNWDGPNSQGGAGEGYLFDVFLSYSYKSPSKEWATKTFNPLFEKWLDLVLVGLGSEQPPQGGKRVCVAKREMAPGDHWETELEEQLRRSRVLVAILSPHYFISGWCKSEWSTFRQRAPELVIPVLFYGTDEYLKPHVSGIEYTDFRDFKVVAPWRRAQFEQKLIAFTEGVAQKVVSAPPFSAAAPSVILPAAPPPNVEFMSLAR